MAACITTREDKSNQMDQSLRAVTILLIMCMIQVSEGNSWTEWWAYDEGISGPYYWGILNPRWALCNKGRNQSPINIDPKKLLFDPLLSPLKISGTAVSGELMNRGHSLTLEVDFVSHWSEGVNITGGPLSYVYRIYQLSIHFSHSDGNGSEHTVDGKGFAAEIQMTAYNSDLYNDVMSAAVSPRGVVCVSVLVKVCNQTHPHFERIHKVINDTLYKGDRKLISYVNLRRLLPDTEHYVTYEGSFTHPGCHETVTWIIYNKPIYISDTQISGLRRLKKDTVFNPVLLMAGNIRPLQPLNLRTIRTNINFMEAACSMEREMNYRGPGVHSVKRHKRCFSVNKEAAFSSSRTKREFLRKSCDLEAFLRGLC